MKTFEYAKKKALKKTKHPWYTVSTKKWGRVYLWGLPLIPIMEINYAFTNWNYNRKVWSEKRATKVLDYTLPYILDYIADEDAYYYDKEWYPSHFRKYAPFWHRAWARKFSFKIQEYLFNGYSHSEYDIIFECDEYNEWVFFKKKA